MGVGWSVPAASACRLTLAASTSTSQARFTLAPCKKTLAVNFTVLQAVLLGTPNVLTLGATNLDFTLATGSTCVGAVTEGSTCAVNVTFAPRFAGGRKGGVEVVDASGNVLADVPVYGIGSGPQVTFQPGKLSAPDPGALSEGTVVTSTASPWTSSGNLFVAEYGPVYEILAKGTRLINTLSGGYLTQAGRWRWTAAGTSLSEMGIGSGGCTRSWRREATTTVNAVSAIAAPFWGVTSPWTAAGISLSLIIITSVLGAPSGGGLHHGQNPGHPLNLGNPSSMWPWTASGNLFLAGFTECCRDCRRRGLHIRSKP